MTAPTDAPVEERHRRAAAVLVHREVPMDTPVCDYVTGGPFWKTAASFKCARYNRYAQALANEWRDGRASRDAEVEELRAYRRAMLKILEWANAETERESQGEGERGIIRSWKKVRTYLAEELARKGTP